APAWAQYGATNGEWPSYGGDNGGTKYSPLDQIDAGNFSSLEIVWRVPTPDGQLDFEAITEELVRRGRLGESPSGTGNPDYGLSLRLFKATPLMADGLLYVPTPLSLGAAYDAGTGENVWVHDPESYLNGPPASRSNMRGAAYWSDGEIERVYWGTTDGYLLSVDARTGEPATEFGDNGRVDLFTGVPRAERGSYDHRGRNWISVTSPPIVSNGVVVTPVTITDYVVAKEAPPGWVKGIDARTGELRWVFRTVPRGDDFGAETWGNESWRYSGNTNVWAAMSADDELGYVYLPTSTPTSDYYGGHRPGDNLFAESIVAVDIRTGERKWHFQAVHHGVWDYDFPTHPNLVDVTVDGREVKALAQVSKQGFTYVFDRATGE
ncbi:MAG TPA: pyrroloquinoline quinone-dependent dehydrogenase, partial [Acidobacteria bacterium]|nr:pyrroloquinoline quinone-dependent dehydrogenase [Acidobacteriota bacterium]